MQHELAKEGFDFMNAQAINNPEERLFNAMITVPACSQKYLK